MAGKTDAEKGKGKGVAFGKWAKIDKAQRNMFLAVCAASVLLGVTVVGVVYFSKVIVFNGTLISEKDKIIKDYKSIQESLKNISNQVDDLRNDEKLEVVSRKRANDCLSLSNLLSAEEEKIDDIELARVCTALRVIPDAIPSKENVEATLASLNQLLLWSDGAIRIEGLSGADVENSSSSDSSSDSSTGSSLQSIGASLSLNDTAARVHKALDTIEKSIRNYDIASASISFSGDSTDSDTIELSATFRAYYSNSVNIEKKTKTVCADKKSTKCTGKSSSGKKSN
jgi:hypothetical protein